MKTLMAAAFVFIIALFVVVLSDVPTRAQLPISTQPLTRTLNITTSTVLKVGSGALICFNVVTAGGGVGTINDVATTGAAAAANQIATVPTAVGNYCVTFPYFTGLVVIPGASHVISVSFQ